MIIIRLIACFALLLCVSSAPHNPLPNLTNGKNCSCLLGQLLLVLSDLVKNQQSPCNQDQLKPAEADPDSSATLSPIAESANGNTEDPNSHGLGAQGLYFSTTSEPTTTNTNGDSSTIIPDVPSAAVTTILDEDKSNSDSSATTANSLLLDPDSTIIDKNEENPAESITLSTISSENSPVLATTENSLSPAYPTFNTADADTATKSSNGEDVPNFAIADSDSTISSVNKDDTTDPKNSDSDQTVTEPNDVSFANNHNHDSKKCSCGNIDGQFYVPLLRFEGKPDKEAFKFYLDCLFNRKS